MQPLAPQLIVMEASGGYESIVAVSLAEAGLPVAIVNPRQTRKFAEALGQLAKTDAIDARVIAHFAEAIRPPARPMPDPVMDQLRELLARRRQLVVMINAEKQRLAKAESAVTQRSHKAMLRSLEAEPDRIGRAIGKLVEQSPLWCKKLDLLTSVPGVGDVVHPSVWLIAAICLARFATPRRVWQYTLSSQPTSLIRRGGRRLGSHGSAATGLGGAPALRSANCRLRSTASRGQARVRHNCRCPN